MMVHEDVRRLTKLAVGMRVVLRVAQVMQAAAVLYDRDGGRMSKESLSRKKVCFTDTLNSTSSHPRRPWQARLDTHKLSLTAASFSSFKMNCSKSQTMRIFSCKRKRGHCLSFLSTLMHCCPYQDFIQKKWPYMLFLHSSHKSF